MKLALLIYSVVKFPHSYLTKAIVCSAQFSRSVMSDSLWPHGLQHARPACPSPTPGIYSNSCPLSQWCHPTISSSVIPFFSCLQSYPASESFPMSQFFNQTAKVLDLQLQHQSFPWIFRTDFLYDGLVWSCSPRDSQESSPTPQFKSINFWLSVSSAFNFFSFLYGGVTLWESDFIFLMGEVSKAL